MVRQAKIHPALNDWSFAQVFILCKIKYISKNSGKVYYDILSERKKAGLDDVIAVARVEQLSPFPYDLVQNEISKFKNAEIIWAQEEHKNSGFWSFVQPRVNSLLKSYMLNFERRKLMKFFNNFRQNKGVKYAGRKPSASPATGNKYTHKKEHEQMINEILNNLP
jgi:2-oxoglutarate dehydrogenase E1 component